MELLLQASMPPLLLAAALVGVAVLLFVFKCPETRGKGSQNYHPIACTNFDMVVNFSRLYDFLTEVCRRHKSFRMLTSPFRSEVFTSDPAVVEHILHTNSHNYVKGKYIYERMKDLLGDGIFTVDGSKWLQQRKLFSHEFSKRAMREATVAIFRKNAVKLANAIADAADSHSVIDIQEWFSKSTMDTIFEVSFGTELNNLLKSNAETRAFVRAFEESSELINWRYNNPLWKTLRFFNLGSEATLRENIKVVDDYVYKLLRLKIAHLSGQKPGKEDVFTRLLRDRENNLEFMSLRYLRDIFLNFVIAGKDTMAGTLAWLFYLLCKHPRVQERLYIELLEVVGTHGKSSIEEFASKLSDDSLQKLHLLHAAVTETLRLYPGVPVDIKVCLKDDSWPDGRHVRAGELVHYVPYSMGRMERLWGEDAEIFRPERWLDENGKFRPQSPFKFPVFQAGRRMCPGKDFAYQEIKILSAVLIKSYVFKLKNEEEPIRYKMTLTLLKNPGLDVYVFRR